MRRRPTRVVGLIVIALAGPWLGGRLVQIGGTLMDGPDDCGRPFPP
jgi:hypothetical protein